MKKTRWIGAAALAGMLVVCAGAGMLYSGWHQQEIRSAYSQPLAAAPWEEDPTAGIDVENGYTVSSDFTTHLPLVILDLDEGEPPISTMRDPVDPGRFIPIEGVDPYVSGTFFLVDNGSGVNRASDSPALTSRMNIKRRGNTSMLYDKAQWLVKLVTESGQDNDLDVLGMGAEHEWVLNGSLADKSLIRNYLVYSIASEFMPYTPDFAFCEVLLKENGVLYYHGVYLLGENLKIGPNRVDVGGESSRQETSYLVRRDRYDEEGCMLQTYAREMGYSKEYFGLISPSAKNRSEEMIQYVEQDLSEVEQVLYSQDLSIFDTYAEYIDVDSFVDYFLVNEFFGSYDSGNYSTYAYKEVGGKLSLGPVWDYDGTIDNYLFEPLSTKDIAFQTKPWFDCLCKDRSFVQKLIDRYAQLRKTSLSENHINEKINEIIAHLGGAEEREWTRWGAFYTGEQKTGSEINLQDYVLEDGTVLYRNAETFEEELYRIRTALFDHGDQIPQALEDLREAASLDSAAVSLRHWMLLLAALVFLIPSLWVALRR